MLAFGFWVNLGGCGAFVFLSDLFGQHITQVFLAIFAAGHVFLKFFPLRSRQGRVLPDPGKFVDAWAPGKIRHGKVQTGMDI
jgi:hypothetical protein